MTDVPFIDGHVFARVVAVVVVVGVVVVVIVIGCFPICHNVREMTGSRSGSNSLVLVVEVVRHDNSVLLSCSVNRHFRDPHGLWTLRTESLSCT